MSKDDGGPAFPHPVNKHDVGMQYAIVDGMSLRDWFAGQALAVLDIQAHVKPPAAHHLAESTYHIADAMLKERAGGRENPC